MDDELSIVINIMQNASKICYEKSEYEALVEDLLTYQNKNSAGYDPAKLKQSVCVEKFPTE